MLGLTNLEVYNSTLSILEEIMQFELYTDPFDEFSFEKLKDELEETPKISHNTPYHLQHGNIVPRNIEAYKT